MTSNRIKAVTVYEALNGQHYTSIDEAQKMSSQHIAQQKLTELFTKLAQGGFSVNTVVADLITKPEVALKLREGINSALDYHRRYGKLKKA